MTRRPGQRAGRKSILGTENVSPQVVKLSWAERLDILDGLSLLLDQIYVHLPLKRSLYGFDIIRALASLRQQSTSISDIQFHRELTTLINRLRDAHTQYQGPWTQKGVVASLPFLVEAYGPVDDTTYVVSKVDRDCRQGQIFYGSGGDHPLERHSLRSRPRASCRCRDRRKAELAARQGSRIADFPRSRICAAAG